MLRNMSSRAVVLHSDENMAVVVSSSNDIGWLVEFDIASRI